MMENGWFAYQCNSGEILFFYNRFSGEYRWLSCGCSQKINALLCQDENATESVTKEVCKADVSVRSIGTETDSTLPPTVKELRTQGTQTDQRDLVPSTTPTFNGDVFMKEVDPVDCADNQLPRDPLVSPGKRSVVREYPNPRERNSIHNNAITKVGNKVKLYPCSICTKAFTSYTFLTKHLKCHPTLNDQELLKARIDSNHVDPNGAGMETVLDQQKGDTGSEKAAESPSLEATLYPPFGYSTLQCFQCSMTFTSGKAFDDHFGAKHYDDIYCEGCQKAFSCKKRFKLHLLSHFGEKHHCTYCSKKYAIRLGLLRHQRYKHGSIWNNDLQKQLSKLENPKPKSVEESDQSRVAEQPLNFKCGSCDISFGLYSDLVEHQKNCGALPAKTTGDNQEPLPMFNKKRYWCNKCNTSYKSYKSLVRHQKSKYHKTKERQNKTLHDEGENANHCNSSYYCQNCNSFFMDYASLVQHKKNNYCFQKETHIENNIFKCMLCTDVFFSSIALARHIVTHLAPDKDAAYPCNLCKKRLPDKRTLERHLFYHLKVHNCSHCNKSFDKFELLCEHNKTVHSESTNFSCTICNKKFIHLAALTNHYKSHDKSAICSFCGKAFHFAKSLKKHLKKCTQRLTTIRKKKQGNKSEVPKNNLIAHVKKETCEDYSSNENAPVATIEDQPSQSNGVVSDDSEKIDKNETSPQCPNLRARKFKDHPVDPQASDLNNKDKKFQCFKCKAFYSTKNSLIRHQELAMHVNHVTKSLVKRYKCQVCKKAFHLYSVFYQHQLQHKGRKTHRCRSCGTCFAAAKLLVSHKCTVITPKKKEYACTMCCSVFDTGQGLSNHIRGHQSREKGKLLIECASCKKVFENVKRLIKHKRTTQHSQNTLTVKNNETAAENKFYECCSCGKFYSSRKQLLKHKSRKPSCSLSGVKPSTLSKQKNRIKCSSCAQSFQEYSLYRQHFGSVHGDGSPCWLCPKSFSNYGNLNRHVKDIHPGDKQFFCYWCSVEFSSLSDYTKHTGHSNGGKGKHVCSLCGVGFDLCLHLTDHIKTHHK